MRRACVCLTAATMALIVSIAWAQCGGSGSISWDEGYPQGHDDGTITCSGTFDFPSGWSSSFSVIAFAPNFDEATEEYFVYEATAVNISENFPPDGKGTWGATIFDVPPGTYSVMVVAYLSDGQGNTEGVVAAMGTTDPAVGGNIKKLDGGTITFSADPSGANQKITGKGTWKANADFTFDLQSIRAQVIPLVKGGFLGLSWVPDKTRKAFSGTASASSNGTWEVNVIFASEGDYWIEVSGTFVDKNDPTKTSRKNAMKYVKVTK